MTIDVSTIDEFNALPDVDKAEIIHFVAAGVLVSGANEFDVDVSAESLGFGESRTVLILTRFYIGNIVMDELIRRVVAWTVNSMPTMVSDITTAIYE